MKRTTFVFVTLVLACLAILYYEADRGSGPAIVVLAVAGTATLILLGGGLVLAYIYIQSEMEDRRLRRREAENYQRETWKAIIEQSRQTPPPQLTAGEQLQFPAQTFTAASGVPEWLREENRRNS